MELLHPFRAHRERKTTKQVKNTAEFIVGQLEFEASNGGIHTEEFPAGKRIRKVLSGNYLRLLSSQVEKRLAGTALDGAVAYDPEASYQASTEIIGDSSFWTNEAKPELTIVFRSDYTQELPPVEWQPDKLAVD